MDIISFTYEKPGQPFTTRFVAFAHQDNYKIEGWDLCDYQYKTFLRERIKNTPNVVANICDKMDVKLINKQELFSQLSYGSAEQGVVKAVGVTDEKLAQILSDKIGQTVISLGNDHFLIQQVKYIKFEVPTKSGKVYIIVKPGKVEYEGFSGTSIDMDKFTQLVLS